MTLTETTRATTVQSGKIVPSVETIDLSTDAAEFVERFETAWSKSNAAALGELLADDVVLIQPAMPAIRGKKEAKESFSRLFGLIPDLHVRVHRWAASDEVLFIEFTLVGTFGGEEVSWPAVDRFRTRDGLVAERVSYFDPIPLFLTTLRRPRGWRRFVTSGFRPSFASSADPGSREG
jgi:ketosteroid isomerase-like protein